MSTKKLTSFFNIDTTNLDMPSARATLIGGVIGLLIISLLMVASASIPFASSHSMNELYFFQRQLTYMIVGIIGAVTISLIPIRLWMHNLLIQFSGLVITAVLLLATLFFADTINGSKRWLEIGAFNFQTAELAKFVSILFTGSFLVRRSSEVRQNLDAFIRISVVLSVCTVLLLLQPDFGSLVIIVGCILAMFFVAGAPLAQFIILFAILGAVGSATIFLSDYRMARVASFFDPFDDIRGTDYQLARSLIAFGRGEWLGVGYGESVQKLAHLPEAHTDFVLAITGEELGLLGVFTVLALEFLVIASAMKISYNALKRQQMRIGYTAFGIAIMFIGQTFINAGMNMGILPTKGLTMPFFSYGGSSMLICLMMIGLLVRFDKESAKIPRTESRNY